MPARKLALRQFSKLPLCFGLLLALFDIVHPAHRGQEQAKSKQSEIQRRPNIELYCHTIRWEPGWPKRTLVVIYFLGVSNIILNTIDQKPLLKGNSRCTVRCADCVPSGLCLSGKDRFVSCSLKLLASKAVRGTSFTCIMSLYQCITKEAQWNRRILTTGVSG